MQDDSSAERRKWILPTAIAVTVLALDLITKSWALRTLEFGRSVEMIGSWVPFTLAFNRGAAFGISIGSDPRWIFVPVTILAAVFLILLVIQARPDDHLRRVAAALVLGGALGNLFDRVRWERGVVDFIGPVDLGIMLWPIFNVADMAITVGAILLAISFWREELERGEETEAREEEPAGAG